MPSPALIEAASTIIYSAPYINSKGILKSRPLWCEAEPLLDLDAVRNSLAQHLGPEFTRSFMNNRDGHVPRRVLQAMSLPVPSAYHLDYVLRDICKDYGISWSPDPPPRDFVFVLNPC
jgi:vacuolar protein sorting-associated protein IST1